ncbi:CHASE2 domain-containing protein [Dyella sp. BiH032]|uniref:CHASE2 domain-containing protein n=1 Tax=Dyella sp. BiH032 TaxID=3075430 RepID=UPI0028938222|nr:CHASE2 domain-containing protein [Dyella sp. BiH032]WNL44733.1 CHASE2 domain-containing protein [Dyella sp. BiH032]
MSAVGMLGRVLGWMIGVAVLTLVLASGVAMRLDNAFYDTHMRHWDYRPGDAVVIVAIDPKSLAAVGNWPWPRAVHARLLDRLTEAGVRAVGMDITMAEPDLRHPENDEALADAMRRNGRVVMPVFPEAAELGGTLEEMLPTPELAGAAAAFGHVDAAKDDDGVVRGAYLKAGLGSPYWSALAVAVRDLGQRSAGEHEPLSLRRSVQEGASPYQWLRDDYVMLHFAGPAGSFDQVSYVDVLEGRTPASLLKNRWVLIGATAAGLGDLLDTSASGGNERMPGVEYQANLLESVQDKNTLVPLNFSGQLMIGAAVLALPFLLYGWPGLRSAKVVALVTAMACLLLSVTLLREAGWWWPPTACLAVILAGTVLMSLIEGVRRHRS